jgi:multiple sugar transport system substrate-binding protein
MLLAAGCSNSGGGSDSAAGGGGAATGGKSLNIAWAEWDPAKQMQTLTEGFTKETGIKVTVKTQPWSNFETEIKKTWTAQGDTYDLIIGDSQWLGKAATSGHYVDLTEWAKTNVPIADIEEAALKNYGEYDGKLWAVPCMADGIGFAYRKDLFEDAKEKADFKAKYSKELTVPATWDDFARVAEFFTRPSKNLYGAALFFSKEYDGATMGFDQVLWALGGKLEDGGKVEGVLNNAAGVKALEFYANLKKFTPPGSETFYFAECLSAFQKGQVAIAESWFAFFPDLQDKAKNPFADKTGYFQVPKGPAGQFVSLGGQGLSVSAYSKHQDEAKQFIQWFSKEETQKKWVALGGLTANKKVAASDDFKNAKPWNATFAASAAHLKDFYNNPSYSELLTVSQTELNAAIAGTKKPKDALDAIAKAQQEILDKK